MTKRSQSPRCRVHLSVWRAMCQPHGGLREDEINTRLIHGAVKDAGPLGRGTGAHCYSEEAGIRRAGESNH